MGTGGGQISSRCRTPNSLKPGLGAGNSTAPEEAAEEAASVSLRTEVL